MWSSLSEPQASRIHVELLLLGFLFFFIHIVARYYVVLILLPQGTVVPAMITVRDNLLQTGILISAVALILPSVGFKKDEERIVGYLFALTALVFMLGIYLGSIKSPAAVYVFYNSAAILLVLAAAIFLGYLGFRGKPIGDEPERITMAALALILLVNLAIAVWSFYTTSAGRTVSANFDILRDHAARYAIWTVLAALFMRFGYPSDRFYRRIVQGLALAVLFWALTFGLYALGVQAQIISGAMDVLLGLLVVIVLLNLWGLKNVRGPTTPHLTLGTVSLVWFIVAGAVGLYMTIFFSANQLPVPGGWRLFHLINANWSLLAGLGTIALASSFSSKRLGWLLTLLFSAGMIKAVATYLVNLMDPNAATPLLLLGEPFLAVAFLLTVYILFRSRRPEYLGTSG